MQELEVARTILVTPDIDAPTIPQLEVEVRIPLAVGNHTSRLHLRCVMPPGYPDIPLRVEAWAADMRVSQRQDISNILNGKAKLIVGSESVMALVEDFKLLASNIFSQHETVAIPTNDSPAGRGRNFGRRWIWVHHITDTDRRKSILHQMRDMNLSGFLKYGYPGIVLIEGVSSCCDEFVAWIKGSKSRPGGFGRNWGHHVRGSWSFSRNSFAYPHEQSKNRMTCQYLEGCAKPSAWKMNS